MDDQVPAVVAVMVASDPGPWFEEALASLAAQDYEELSVLVLDTGAAGDVATRVGQLLPEAFVRQLPDSPGYGAASNEALGMVEGAAFFLLLHDDCALDPDALHKLVEESYRSNAGIVSPKFVYWDAPGTLQHVGMNCDKTGAVVNRIQDGEVDHGQHDAVRDVFVAPSGCTLVRADLWRELGGFDAGIVAMGEDLDLCWRAQVAGSRVVVAPEARVRHMGAVVVGARPLTVLGLEGTADGPTLLSLQRRHELRSMLKCYSPFHLARVLPQAILLSLGEVIVALLARDRARARAVSGAWLWNLRHLGELREQRRLLHQRRLFPDAEVRRLQLRGSARLSLYMTRLSHQGFEVANAVAASRGRSGSDEDSEVAVLTGSVGLAFSENSDFDELDDLGHRSGRDRFGRPVRRAPLTTSRHRAVALIVTALVLVIGTRELFFGSLPLLGQLAPMSSWAASWHHFFSGWQSAGVGSTAPASPAFGIAGIVGTVLLGAMGTAQKVLLLGCLPLGAVGLSRLMRPLVSPRARVIAVICYLGLPLPYGALGTGRWDGMVAFAALPFIVARLARAAGLAPFDQITGNGWRATPRGQIAILGLIIAGATSFAPAVLPMVVVCAIALVIGSSLAGTRAQARRVFAVVVPAILLALVLCAPWVIGTALAGSHAVTIFGLPISPAAAPSWGEVLRFAIGPVARSPIAWLLVAAAALPLAVGTGSRLLWATRLWTTAIASWVLAYAGTHGWMGSFAPSESVVLVPAAIAVAACIGLGISAFENDLSGLAFGWRQVVSGTAVVAAVVGLLPVVAGAVNGRWDLPASGIEQPLAALARPPDHGAYRILWLGDPRSLPVGGWSISPGLSYALTSDALPDTTEVLTPAAPGPATLASKAVKLAMTGGTVHLGRLLAAQGVLYVVVVDSLSPSAGSLPTSVAAPPPTRLSGALQDQNDLQIEPGEFGIQVYRNADVIPVTAERAQSLPSTHVLSWPGGADVVGWQPVLTSLSGVKPGTGRVQHTVYAGYAPSGRVTLQVGTHTAARRPAFGWASEFSDVPAGRATLAVHVPPYTPVAELLELLLWIGLFLALSGWRGRFRRPPMTEDAP